MDKTRLAFSDTNAIDTKVTAAGSATPLKDEHHVQRRSSREELKRVMTSQYEFHKKLKELRAKAPAGQPGR